MGFDTQQNATPLNPTFSSITVTGLSTLNALLVQNQIVYQNLQVVGDFDAVGIADFKGGVLLKPTLSVINSTALATAAEIVSGISSTSAAPTTITTPTATQIGTQLNYSGQGNSFEFVIDNSAGANTVTLALDASISVATPAITGGALLTVSTANKIGVFRLYFTGNTTAIISRII